MTPAKQPVMQTPPSARRGHFASVQSLRRFPCSHSRSGLSLVEVVLAITIMTLTGSALLTAAMSAIDSGSLMSRTLVAEGIADQLADEIYLVGFPRGANTLPTPGTPRVAFNHVDDFGNYSCRPPVNRNGRVLGTEDVSPSTSRNAALQPQAGYLDSFRQSVSVEQVSPNSSGFDVVSMDTDYRRVTVTVSYQEPNGGEIPLVKRTLLLSRVGFTP